MNQVVILGRATADPSCRYTQSGKCVTEITLAVDRGYGDKKKTSFITCQSWEKQAETLANSVSKGQRLLVEGKWAQQTWETNEGQKRRKDYVEIDTFEFIEKKQPEQDRPDGGTFGGNVFPEEEIPF